MSRLSRPRSPWTISSVKFKKRNTVQNKLNLIAAEEEFKKAKEDAQESWTGELTEKFESTRNLIEMWSVYKKMTQKAQSNSVLPLIQEDSTPVLDPMDKCTKLQKTFFDKMTSLTVISMLKWWTAATTF